VRKQVSSIDNYIVLWKTIFFVVVVLFSQVMKETKLNQNGLVETNDLFCYKGVQPQPKFSEYYKYNVIMSSNSSS
jgi:hypothetical protein